MRGEFRLHYQQKVPIVEALQKYICKGTIRFHMPGHRGRRAADNLLADFLGSRVFAADVTNVPGMDDLHQTHGVIREAQERAASVFGADYTYFLINGSSCGLLALVLTVCNPGDRILVPRNMHRSILSGIILSGAVPVFFTPEYDEEYGIFLGTPADTIARGLESHPNIKAVIIVNPTYHGITSNLARVAQIVHARGIPLLVDEAHGPHLHFHGDLPPDALASGADAAVQGTHKILGAFTQASMLHIKGGLVDKHRLEGCLRLVQSTSTSYLLLASLDTARAHMEANGRQLVETALQQAAYLRHNIMSMPRFSVLGPDRVGGRGIFGLDPTKITISVRELGISGLWAERWLREEHRIQVEMAEMFGLLLIIGFGNRRADLESFLRALEGMVRYTTQNRAGLYQSLPTEGGNGMPGIPELVISPREAFGAPVTTLPLHRAVGRVSAEVISCYPPGIPVLCPGEKVTAEIVTYLTAQRNVGAHFQGCSDPRVQTLRVVR